MNGNTLAFFCLFLSLLMWHCAQTKPMGTDANGDVVNMDIQAEQNPQEINAAANQGEAPQQEDVLKVGQEDPESPDDPVPVEDVAAADGGGDQDPAPETQAAEAEGNGQSLGRPKQENTDIMAEIQEMEQGQAEAAPEEVKPELKPLTEEEAAGQVGVQVPEEVMHVDGEAAHAHGAQEAQQAPHQHAEGEEPCIECLKAEEEAKRLKAERVALEDSEVKQLEPMVKANVHDGQARAQAEILKQVPIQAGDLEAAMHGGHHVHGEGESNKGEVGVQGVEAMLPKEEEKEAEKKKSQTLDPEDLMHGAGSDGHDHGANPHKPGADDEKVKNVGLKSPEDIMHEGQEGHKGAGHHKTRPKKVNTEKLGVDVEKAVHGQDHVHDHSAKGSHPSKKITYSDIVALGLKESMLEGVNLTNLLLADEKDYGDWKEEEEGEGTREEGSFWDHVNAMREQYLEDLSKRVRDITHSKDSSDDAVDDWDDEHDDGDEVRKHARDPHEGESQLEHEMELWGNTAPDSQRKPWKDKHRVM